MQFIMQVLSHKSPEVRNKSSMLLFENISIYFLEIVGNNIKTGLNNMIWYWYCIEAYKSISNGDMLKRLCKPNAQRKHQTVLRILHTKCISFIARKGAIRAFYVLEIAKKKMFIQDSFTVFLHAFMHFESIRLFQNALCATNFYWICLRNNIRSTAVNFGHIHIFWTTANVFSDNFLRVFIGRLSNYAESQAYKSFLRSSMIMEYILMQLKPKMPQSHKKSHEYLLLSVHEIHWYFLTKHLK